MGLKETFGPGWWKHLEPEFKKPYMRNLSKIIQRDRRKHVVLPEPHEVFRAFQLTPYEDVKVVILGQDPYPTVGHPNGLAFSMKQDSIDDIQTVPRSLQNILKEVDDDIGFSMWHNPDLTRWAKQGVLLLNCTLTVIAGAPQSHKNIGWYHFIMAVIHALNKRKERVFYLLWGRVAQGFEPMIRLPHDHLEAGHPSPLNRNKDFAGCRHFSKVNDMLKVDGQEPIDWLADNS